MMKVKYVSILLLGLLGSFFTILSVIAETQSKSVLGRELRPHPRLLFTDSDEIRVNNLLKTNKFAKRLSDKLHREADRLLTVPVEYRFYEDGSKVPPLHISREYVYRMITLSMAYRLYDDDRYAEKVKESLEYIFTLPLWNTEPAHFLDVAAMTTAVAIAYDWTYDYLPESLKGKIRFMVKRYALDHAVKEYRKGDNTSWAKRETNWNVVCNTGMSLGALAFAEDYVGLADTIITNSVKYMPNCLRFFAPDGICYEGPAYWAYTNVYLSMMMKAMDDNLGSCMGIDTLPGISNTARFYVEATSPSKRIFNFGDCTEGTLPYAGPAYFYFSRKFQQPDVAHFARETIMSLMDNKERTRWHFFLSLAWCDISKPEESAHLEKVKIYRGINDIVIFREGHKKDDLFLIAKGGAPDMAHQQMDAGNFIIERYGIRWLEDLGADNYDLPGFWDSKDGGKRWNYFRNTNYSHNTLIINDDKQCVSGRAYVMDKVESKKQTSVAIDLTSVYQKDADRVIRRFSLSNKGLMIVGDSIYLKDAEGTVCWNAVTSSKVLLDGKKAVLEKDGKKFVLQILSPKNAKFSTTVAKPLTPFENPVTGYTLLQIRLDDCPEKEQYIEVQLGE
ncbi:heparinase II/III family protein [Gabonia massiliensis]|uniref:heparinase II/III domain-containing protein n=1 Tax=Gabonia massiliensis TaxID=1686296 RepID=UPI0006D7FECD|nr:heparinase II/III family protein [Gabonia massiliensis]